MTQTEFLAEYFSVVCWTVGMGFGVVLVVAIGLLIYFRKVAGEWPMLLGLYQPRVPPPTLTEPEPFFFRETFDPDCKQLGHPWKCGCPLDGDQELPLTLYTPPRMSDV